MDTRSERAEALHNRQMGASVPQYRPWWAVWGPPAAVVWAVGYGSLRLFWVLGERPWLPPTGDDLLAFSDWGAVGLCAGAALVSAVLAFTVPRRWALRGLVATGAVVVVGLLAASAVLLVDVVGLLLPGLGVMFHAGAFLSRLGALLVAVATGATVLAAHRRGRDRCVACGRNPRGRVPAPQPSRTVFVAAYLVVVACLTRVGAQIVADRAAGGTSLFEASPAAGVAFTAGAVLAGTLLPLALVHSWGRVWPGWVRPLAGRQVTRWLPLGPGMLIGVGMTMYFGVTLTQFLVAGVPIGEPYPAAFWWVTVPAYFIWGVGLCVAAASYWRITRPPCRICGLGRHDTGKTPSSLRSRRLQPPSEVRASPAISVPGGAPEGQSHRG
jgi:hypothetical protein